MTPGLAAQTACLMEATARKPGNVHRFADFSDATYFDFAMSALAIGPAMEAAGTIGVGRAVISALTATRAVTGTNTNLGMLLLLAPLAVVTAGRALRAGVAAVLEATTIEDADLVYQAIRLANPGGLGAAAEQDVAGRPTCTLKEAMRLAADRDVIARQYVLDFQDVFDVTLAALGESLAITADVETAVVRCHLCTMAAIPDTLIARKLGATEALESSTRALAVLDAGWPDTERGRRLFDDFDGWLRGLGRSRNPGATADLVAAALFVALRDGTIRFPLGVGGPPWTASPLELNEFPPVRSG